MGGASCKDDGGRRALTVSSHSLCTLGHVTVCVGHVIVCAGHVTVCIGHVTVCVCVDHMTVRHATVYMSCDSVYK